VNDLYFFTLKTVYRDDSIRDLDAGEEIFPKYLIELERLLENFSQLGVEAIAISCDSQKD
jgi:hypothetical protein